MNRIVGTAAWAALFVSSTAFADIIEVRGKGMMTGKITSQNEKEITFRDNDGKETRFAKSDVLFFDRDDASDAPSSKKPKKDYLAPVRKFFSGAPYWLRDFRDWTDEATKKFRAVAGKPIDRSGADQKGAQLAKTMDEATKHQAELIRRQKKVQQALNRQTTGGSSSNDESNSGFNGTFGKL